jgi:hypothetical protein
MLPVAYVITPYRVYNFFAAVVRVVKEVDKIDIVKDLPTCLSRLLHPERVYRHIIDSARIAG